MFFMKLCVYGVGIGLWFLIAPPVIKNPVLGAPGVLIGTGSALLFFCSIVGTYLFIRLRKSPTALVITRHGLMDYTRGNGFYVAWDDVEAVEELMIAGEKMVHVRFRDPQARIQAEPEGWNKRWMHFSWKTSGAAYTITARGLNCNHETLLATIREFRPIETDALKSGAAYVYG